MLAGVLVAFVLAASRDGLKQILIIPRKQDESNENPDTKPRPEAPFGADQRFEVLFELRYHPKYGSHENAKIRALMFGEFWPEFKASGEIDRFAIYDRVRRFQALTQAQREQLLKDLTALEKR